MPHVRIEIEEVAGGPAARGVWHATVEVGARCAHLTASSFAETIGALSAKYHALAGYGPAAEPAAPPAAARPPRRRRAA